MTQVAAIIAAAGSSNRLGQPKQLLRIDGEPMLQRATRIAGEAGAAPVIVVLGAHRQWIEPSVDLAGASIVVNQAWEEGIGSSIRAGMEALRTDAPGVSGVLLMICDQPRVTADHLRRMIMAFSRSPENAIASIYADRRGTPAIFPRAAFHALSALQGDTGARSLLARPSWPVTEIPLDGGEVDIDTPEDLAQLH